MSLKHKFVNDETLLTNCTDISKDHLKAIVIEKVDANFKKLEVEKVHYLPHRLVTEMIKSLKCQ